MRTDITHFCFFVVFLFCFVFLVFWFFFYILYIYLVINVLVQTVEAGQYSYNPSVAVSVKSANRKVVPTIWKTADVIPMYKEDEETDKRNYLGISLLSAPGKLMESTETSTPDVLATSPNFVLSKLTVWCRDIFLHHTCARQFEENLEHFLSQYNQRKSWVGMSSILITVVGLDNNRLDLK